MEKHVVQSGRDKRQSLRFLSWGRMEKGLHDTGMTLKTRFAQVTIPWRQFRFIGYLGMLQTWILHLQNILKVSLAKFGLLNWSDTATIGILKLIINDLAKFKLHLARGQLLAHSFGQQN